MKVSNVLKSLQLVILLLASHLGSAAAADWQYAGEVADGVGFFDADSVSRSADKIVNVRVRIVDGAKLRSHYFKNETTLRKDAAQRIASGYVPRYMRQEQIKAKYRAKDKYGMNLAIEAAVNVITAHEVQVNKFNMPARQNVHFAIDCRQTKGRILESVLFDESGRPTKSSSESGAWQDLTSNSLGGDLSLMLCTDKS